MNHRTQIEHRGSSSFSILLYSSIAFIEITYHNPFNDKILAEPEGMFIHVISSINQKCLRDLRVVLVHGL